MTTLVHLRDTYRLRCNPLFNTPGPHWVAVCLEPHFWEGSQYGIPRMSDRRKRYLLEGLEELRADLRAMGGDLLVRKGKAEEVLPTLAEQLHAKRVVTALGGSL